MKLADILIHKVLGNDIYTPIHLRLIDKLPSWIKEGDTLRCKTNTLNGIRLNQELRVRYFDTWNYPSFGLNINGGSGYCCYAFEKVNN